MQPESRVDVMSVRLPQTNDNEEPAETLRRSRVPLITPSLVVEEEDEPAFPRVHKVASFPCFPTPSPALRGCSHRQSSPHPMATVAPTALTLGSTCAGFPGVTSGRGVRACFQKLPLHSLHSDRLLRRDAPLRILPGRPFRPLRAVALDSDQSRSSPLADEVKPRRYYFVVANAKFMLDEEEHFQEQLSERLRLFGERNREQDFWLVVEPKFLDKFPEIADRLKRPAVALVSTDGPWITFMKLRLDRVLAENFEAHSLEEALASNPVDLDFEKPEKWVAPYPKYQSGWWERFLPPGSSKAVA